MLKKTAFFLMDGFPKRGTGEESGVQTELCSQPWIDCTLKQILPVAVMLSGHLHGN